MPELPEVETIVRDLRKRIVSKKIKTSNCSYPKIIRGAAFDDLSKSIRGRSAISVQRRGKNILVGLSGGQTLWVHLKMTGNLLFEGPGEPVGGRLRQMIERKHVHFEICFDDGSRLLFADIRKFGRVALIKEESETIARNPREHLLGELGLEPLSDGFTFEKFVIAIGKRKKSIKEVLMDQRVIAGIGNIYANEILFDAKINPFENPRFLTHKELSRLFLSIKTVLRKAIRFRGTSFSDYRDAGGKKGAFAAQLKVYRKAGEKCPRCGNIIQKSKQAQRSTFYCGFCQAK